jgi:CheY-like chemotaxis protein
LEKLFNVQIDTIYSTDEALEQIKKEGDGYDFVITDKSRPGDRNAGFTLLDRLRQERRRMPFIFYTASADPTLDQRARARGALGSTSSPRELINLVEQAVRYANAASRPAPASEPHPSGTAN